MELLHVVKNISNVVDEPVEANETYVNTMKEEPHSIFEIKISPCIAGAPLLLCLYLPALSDAIQLEIWFDQKCNSTISDFLP